MLADRATVPLLPTVDIDIELVGSAEGVPVEITGHGSVDPDSGWLAPEVRTARSLLLLDPALIALGLLDVLAVAATQPWPTDPDAHVHVRSRTDLYDEHGREAGGWQVVAALGRTGGGVRLAGQLLDHVVRIEPGERVVAVDAPWAVLVQRLEPEGVLLTGAWDARTGRGNGYRAVVTTLVQGVAGTDVESAALRLAFNDVVIRPSSAGRPGEAVTIEAGFVPSGQFPRQV